MENQEKINFTNEKEMGNKPLIYNTKILKTSPKIFSYFISPIFIIIFIILFIFLYTGYPYSIIYIGIFCIGFLPLSIIYYVILKINDKKIKSNLIANEEIYETHITTKILGIFIIITTIIGLSFYLINYEGEKNIKEGAQADQLNAQKDSQVVNQYYEKYLTLFSTPKVISNVSSYKEDTYGGFLLWFEFSFSNTDVKVRNNIYIETTTSNYSPEIIQKIENKVQKELNGKSVSVKLPDSENEFEKYVTTHRIANDSGYLGLDIELTRIKADVYMNNLPINDLINKIIINISK